MNTENIDKLVALLENGMLDDDAPSTQSSRKAFVLAMKEIAEIAKELKKGGSMKEYFYTGYFFKNKEKVVFDGDCESRKSLKITIEEIRNQVGEDANINPDTVVIISFNSV